LSIHPIVVEQLRLRSGTSRPIPVLKASDPFETRTGPCTTEGGETMRASLGPFANRIEPGRLLRVFGESNDKPERLSYDA
jgi:hypothetical protein